MKRFAFYFLLLSFLASCSSKHEAGQYSNEVEVKPSSNEIIKLSEFVEDVKFVELEMVCKYLMLTDRAIHVICYRH